MSYKKNLKSTTSATKLKLTTTTKIGTCGRPGFHPWVGKIPWRRKWQLTPVFCPESSMDRGAWRATVHGVTKSQNDRMTKHKHRICLDVMECERREAKLGLALH